MKNQPPSIFNDVIGPVMRGSSSSHTAASVRIGRIVRQCLPAPCRCCRVEFDPEGSLASTYREQGADIGLAGGLLGMDLDDPDLAGALQLARQENLDLSFAITSLPADHPNTYRIKATAENGEERQITALSTGGGMIEITRIDDFDVSIGGDFHETLLFYRDANSDTLKKYERQLKELIDGYEYTEIARAGSEGLINLKTGYKLEDSSLENLTLHTGARAAIRIEPALPVRSRKNCRVPFHDGESALVLAENENLALWELALRYESARGAISKAEVYRMAEEVAGIMKQSVREGLAGTDYENRILGPQARKMIRSGGKMIGDKLTTDLIANISAVMETKSAFGIIVAAPTAGSCGTLPGTFTAVAENMRLNKEQFVKGLLAAGLTGVLIAQKSTFAAEECGCQAECGSASGMAAAGLIQMMEGSVEAGFDAAAMALQNVMGMVCDPVAERVEVPCLGKNVMAGLNALGCANMALAGYDKVIPLDETIGAMHSCGRMLPPELRCTGRGGLSVTGTAQKIYENLKNIRTNDDKRINF